LSAEVVEKGLVRELRPVFIYDKKLAKEKQGNAARQDKFRAEREKQGLKTGLAPIEVLEKVKELGGGAEGWVKFMALSGGLKEASLGDGVVKAPVVDEAIVQKLKEDNHFLVTEVSQMKAEIDDLTARLAIKPLVQEVVKEVVKTVPGETIYKEKIIEKQVLRLNSEGRKMLKIGEKVAALTGWKLKIVQFLVGI
jgi:hypothetical protein